jgi:hypothetical protein
VQVSFVYRVKRESINGGHPLPEFHRDAVLRHTQCVKRWRHEEISSCFFLEWDIEFQLELPSLVPIQDQLNRAACKLRHRPLIFFKCTQIDCWKCSKKKTCEGDIIQTNLVFLGTLNRQKNIITTIEIFERRTFIPFLIKEKPKHN